MDKKREKTNLIELKKKVSEITQKNTIKSVAFIGCGASMSELYPAQYFLKNEAQYLNSTLTTANEFNYSKPANAGQNSLAVIASLGGTTKESVEAVKNAKNWGYTVVAVTYNPKSLLTKNADYVLVHGFFKDYASKAAKTKIVLELAAEILQQIEGYKYYNEFQSAMAKIDDVVNAGAASAINEAKKFAEKYKEDKLIYTIASGATFGTAYSTANFLFMEMQWIASPVIHSGEYFHGPFEMTNADVPYLLFMNEGTTRHLDARVLEFLQRFSARYTVIDAKDYGLGNICTENVIDYFNPLVITGIMRVYAEQLAVARKHPLTKRQYMWKLENY